MLNTSYYVRDYKSARHYNTPLLRSKPGKWERLAENTSVTNIHAIRTQCHFQPALLKCSSHMVSEGPGPYMCPSGTENNNLQTLGVMLLLSHSWKEAIWSSYCVPLKEVYGSVWQPGGQRCHLRIVSLTPETEHKINLILPDYSFRDQKTLPRKMSPTWSPTENTWERHTLVVLGRKGKLFLPRPHSGAILCGN